MTRVVLLAMSTNHVNILRTPARILEEHRASVIWVAADCNQPRVDSSEAELGRHSIQFLRFPFARFNRYRFIPGHRKLRAPAAGRNIRRLLEHAEADVVVVGNDTRPVGIDTIRAARSLSIPSILVQDGVRPIDLEPAQTLRMRLISPSHGRGYGTGDATHIAVMSESFANELVSAGVDVDRIHVIGHPPYDQLHGLERTSAPPKNVLFIDQALQIPIGDRVELLSHLASTANAAGLTLIVKLHPRDRSVGELTHYLGDKQGVVLVPSGTSVDIWDGTILALTRFSTMAFEAIARGIPIITIDLADVKWRLPLRPEVPSVSDIADLSTYIHSGQNMLADLEALAMRERTVLERETHSSDGKASERLAQLILDVAGAQAGVEQAPTDKLSKPTRSVN